MTKLVANQTQEHTTKQEHNATHAWTLKRQRVFFSLDAEGLTNIHQRCVSPMLQNPQIKCPSPLSCQSQFNFQRAQPCYHRVCHLSDTPYKALIPVTPTTPWIKILAAKPQVPHEMAFEGRAEEQQWRLPPATELTQNILKQQSVLDISKRRRTSILGHMVPMLLDDATEAIQFTQQTTSQVKLQGSHTIIARSGGAILQQSRKKAPCTCSLAI